VSTLFIFVGVLVSLKLEQNALGPDSLNLDLGEFLKIWDPRIGRRRRFVKMVFAAKIWTIHSHAACMFKFS
jgi:hypothetical protein